MAKDHTKFASSKVPLIGFLILLSLIAGCKGCKKATETSGNEWDPRNVSRNEGKSILPSLAIDNVGNLFLVWADSTPGNYEILYSTKSSGEDWVEPVNISNNPTESRASKVVIDLSGNLHIVWEERGIGIFYSMKPEGGDWTTPTKISDSGQVPDLGVDANGNIHVIWIYPNSYRMKTAEDSWMPIESNAFYGVNAALAVSDDGDAHVVSDETIGGGGGNNIYYFMKPFGGSWTEPLNLSESSTYSWIPAVALGENGKVYVSWTGKETNQVYFRIRSPDETWSEKDSIPDIEGDSWGSKIVVANSTVHFVWEAYTDEYDYDLYYISYANGIWFDISDIAETPEASLYSSIVLDLNNLHIAWQEGSVNSTWEIFYVVVQTK